MLSRIHNFSQKTGLDLLIIFALYFSHNMKINEDNQNCAVCGTLRELVDAPTFKSESGYYHMDCFLKEFYTEDIAIKVAKYLSDHLKRSYEEVGLEKIRAETRLINAQAASIESVTRKPKK